MPRIQPRSFRREWQVNELVDIMNDMLIVKNDKVLMYVSLQINRYKEWYGVCMLVYKFTDIKNDIVFVC